MLLWASEPGITYYGAGIGANIDFDGQYYGRRSSSISYGVYMRFDPANGNTYFNTTTGAPNTAGGQGATRFQIQPDGTTISYNSSRAQVFYDYNDTAYYVDPNSTSRSARLRGEIYIGSNTSGKYLRLGGNGGNTDVSTISTSNGNLHIDATSGYNLYLA